MTDGDVSYEYLTLVSKYWQKNEMWLKKDINLFSPVSRALDNNRNLKWFELIFDLCVKVSIPPKKHDFEYAMEHNYFEFLISKECQSIIRENYNKYYSKKEATK